MMNEMHTGAQISPPEMFLQKPRSEFRKADIVRYIRENSIRMLNFRYAGGDGRLKTLNIPLQSPAHLDAVLSGGERVDGSSLFNFLETGSSDLYVVPRFRSAFLDPFSEVPALDILCSFFDSAGEPLSSAPEQIMRKAQRALASAAGCGLELMAEIEYYLIRPREDLYRNGAQRGYHASSPFVKGEALRRDAMLAIVQSGGQVKYGHSEVGNFSDDTFDYEQHEIEFLPAEAEDAADQILIAKWILRETAYRYGMTVSFAPKISTGNAGSGMHIHMRPVKDGRNVTLEQGKLTDTAKRIIAGVLDLAPALCAFGNRVPTSYFRLVPHQEAPTNICWGMRNRSALIRVPLGWSGSGDMSAKANPGEHGAGGDHGGRQTFELRSPDGSADIYLLIAGICVAARHGLRMPDADAFAEKTFVDVNIFDDSHRDRQEKLAGLPASCHAAADALLARKDVFTERDVFTGNIIRGIADKLRSYGDKDLQARIAGKEEETRKLVQRFLHCG